MSRANKCICGKEIPKDDYACSEDCEKVTDGVCDAVVEESYKIFTK